MSKKVSIEDVMPLIEEQINHSGFVTFTPRGNSMLPLLRNNKDTITLKKPDFPLKKYDIAFYKRDSGTYVLHRIVKVNGTDYTMRGDNQFLDENNIRQDQIIGVVDSFTRKGIKYTGSEISYKIYCRLWVKTVSIRRILRIMRRIAGKVKRKIKGKCR